MVAFDGLSADISEGYDEVLTSDKLRKFIEPGSIYEASAFAEELSRLILPDGTRLTKSFIYKDYELWWMHYNNLFLYFCLPYTQYKKLLEYLKTFDTVHFYKTPYKSLFSCFLKAYGVKTVMLKKSDLKSPSFLPFGILMQIMITLLSLPILAIRKPHFMIFVGDKFEAGQDYDFRMKFIYRELRERSMSFVEIIRSLESWKKVLKHAFVVRKRPVIYSEAVTYLGRFLNFLFGGFYRSKYQFNPHLFTEQPVETRFKLLVATYYLQNVYDDIWTIRILKLILNIINIKGAYITATLERNFPTFIACKLNNIPTVGILHGVASLYYNVYDFLPGFDGEKSLSVDKYGLWSEWWKEYYLKNSKVYLPEQLYVSGPMRPLERNTKESVDSSITNSGPIKVLFISEQLAVPEEVMPYLNALMSDKNISVYLTFRPYRDGFENWLREHYPLILNKFEEERIIRTGIKDAIAVCDVATGTMSTAVIETLFQYKVPILFYTKKWGDYFNLREYDNGSFFAENTEELVDKIRKATNVSVERIKNLQKRYFGDPYQNGSKWVVDQLEDALLKGCMTK